MLQYPVKIKTDTVGFLLSCRDLPNYFDCGEDVDETLENAIEGIENAISIYIDQNIPVPLPSTKLHDEYYVSVSAISSLKINLHNTLISRNISRIDFAQLIDCDSQTVERLLDLTYKSDSEKLETACDALDKLL